MVVQYTTIESMIGQKLGWFISAQPRFAKLLWFTLIGISNKYNLAVMACISSSFSTVIHFMYQINYNCFNEPFAVLLCSYLYLDMHGLVFETSIWLLAESTRYYIGQWPCSLASLKYYDSWLNDFAMQFQTVKGPQIFLFCHQLAIINIKFSQISGSFKWFSLNVNLFRFL